MSSFFPLILMTEKRKGRSGSAPDYRQPIDDNEKALLAI